MRRRALRCLLVLLSVLAVGEAQAHEVRSGYLQIRQTGGETFDVLWKVPARGETRIGLRATLPENCETVGSATTRLEGGASIERWTAICPGGLSDGTVAIEGFSSTITDVLVRLELLDGRSRSALLTPKEPTLVVGAPSDRMGVATTYLRLGFDHILMGVDHLLFVLALLILVEGNRRLVVTVTAFTVAHSLTLGAATLGFVDIPQQPVEAVIALSILLVAGEIAHTWQGRSSLTRRWPWVVAFIFGLLHGFGFAGALSEVGLPEESIPLALLFFNVGVEAGQLFFVGVALCVTVLAARITVRRPTWVSKVPTYGIGALAALWTIDRVVGFWS